MNIPMKNLIVSANGDGAIHIDGRTTVTDESGHTVAHAQIIVPTPHSTNAVLLRI